MPTPWRTIRRPANASSEPAPEPVPNRTPPRCRTCRRKCRSKFRRRRRTLKKPAAGNRRRSGGDHDAGAGYHTADDSEAADWSETFPAAPPPPRRWPWVVGTLLALAALGLKALLTFRVELAVLWPPTKPALVALCQFAGCEVGLPTKVGMVGIEASDLHPDSGHPGRLALAATLKNRAPFAQQFPHLELTLTDTADQAIARKVLAPADYLPPATPLAAGCR